MDHYIVTLLCMIVVGSECYASTTPEIYWKKVLPNTPMPQAVINSLPHPGPKKRIAELIKDTVEVQVKFSYGKAPPSTGQRIDESTRGLFFLEKDMKVGSHKILQYHKSLNDATFLTREEANALPFSSDKLPEILQQFSLKSDSAEAQTMKETIKECETKGIQGEEKYCATSLESMVDYATSTLGKNIKAISTIEHKNNNNVEKYTIIGVKRTTREDKNIVCHKENYPYAVFYCHKTKATLSYMVSLVGSNGSWAKEVAVCHKDTSGWNPKHLAFQLLNVKPGTVPICHFLPKDHIMWVPNN